MTQEASVRCPHCKETKSREDFYKNRSRACGLDCWCKKCQLQAQAERHKTHRAKYRQHRVTHPKMNMLTGARRRARLKGIEFSITLDDIDVPKYCPILNIELAVHERAANENSPTLDRIDVTKGYVKGNVAVISARANRLKNDGTIEEISAVLAYIKARIGKE